jgi:hypothetical protein
MLGPVTPNRAVATSGPVTESAADDETPPKDAVIVADIAPLTARVAAENAALVEPPETITLDGTLTGSAAVSETTAPPDGAAPLSVTVPLTEFPPTTLTALSDTDDKMRPMTVSVDDWRLLLRAAAIDVLPAASAVTMNVPLVAPAAIVIDAGVEATEGVPLVRVMLTPPDGAGWLSMTVP